MNELNREVIESSSEKRIAALELEVHAAQTDMKLEKLRSQSALERIVLLEAQIRMAFDIITSIQEDTKIQHEFQGDIENTNVLSESRHTTLSSVGTASVDPRSWKNIPEGLLSSFEVETLRGQLSSPPPHLEAIELEVKEKDAAYDEPVTVLEEMELEDEEKDVAHDEPVTVLEVMELEDEEKDAAHDEPVTVLEAMELDNKEKDVATQEREVVRDAIKRFSSSNPRKWVDACKEELQKTYKIEHQEVSRQVEFFGLVSFLAVEYAF